MKKMTKTREKHTITEAHKQGLRNYMAHHGLNTRTWALKADIPYTTFKNYFERPNGVIGSDKLHKLANAVNSSIDEILGRSVPQSISIDLLSEAHTQSDDYFSEYELQEKLSQDERASFIAQLYGLMLVEKNIDISTMHKLLFKLKLSE